MSDSSHNPRWIKSMTWKQVARDWEEKNRQAHDEHIRTGGMCQMCKVRKAQYPSGLNPYHCEVCNAKTQEILNKLHNLR